MWCFLKELQLASPWKEATMEVTAQQKVPRIILNGLDQNLKLEVKIQLKEEKQGVGNDSHVLFPASAGSMLIVFNFHFLFFSFLFLYWGLNLEVFYH